MNNVDVIQKMINRISSEYELANNDLSTSENKDNSVSLMLRSRLVMRLSLNGIEQFFLANITYELIASRLGFQSEKNKSTPNFIKVTIGDLELNRSATNLIEEIVKHAINTYSEGDFGCCHRYVECSDNLKCAHPDRLYSNSCQYKRNLMNGKIFYGKNANIGTK